MTNKKIFTKEIIKESEISIFNFIGGYAKSKGYNPIFFTTAMPTGLMDSIDLFIENKEDVSNMDFKLGTMHYIHLVKDNKLNISIYYDNEDMAGIMGVPYYEVYDMENIKRFYEDETDEMFNFVEGLMK